MLPEDGLERVAFRDVIVPRSGPMSIDVFDAAGRQAGAAQCALHRLHGPGPLRMRGRRVMGVATRAPAGEAGQYAGAAFARLLFGLEGAGGPPSPPTHS